MTEKKINKVTIEPGCTTCGLCAFIAPDVFEVTDISRVKEDAPLAREAEGIRQAARGCPVNVISIQEE
jgi:ferredoxin